MITVNEAAFSLWLCRQDPGCWWPRAALAAMARGHHRLVYSRHTPQDLYLARFWLTIPRIAEDAADVWESADSILLHYLLGPDDYEALHSHPWCFTSTILAGGYAEERPAEAYNSFSLGGPRADQIVTEAHAAGDELTRMASDLHRIAAVQPGTVTLVRTGPRIAGWGFHPPGLPFISHKDYLK